LFGIFTPILGYTFYSYRSTIGNGWGQGKRNNAAHRTKNGQIPISNPLKDQQNKPLHGYRTIYFQFGTDGRG
jgi:hypothetical protein